MKVFKSYKLNKIKIFNINKFVAIYLVFFLFFIVKIKCQNITKNEEIEINNYVDSVSVKNAIGQLLMVSLPCDILNYEQNPNVIKLIKEYKIGNFMVNTFNTQIGRNSTLSADDVAHKIKEMLESFQKIAIKNNKIPLFIATNFENYSFSSIKNGLYQCPPALTISATQNSKLIELTGHLIGYQLRSIGINMLFGPVLDIYKTRQGTINYNILNRSFGGKNELVYNIISHQIKKIRSYGIIIIGKHIPSLGSIEGNTHFYKKTNLNYSYDNFKNELLPFPKIKNNIDGIMSSHAYISFISQYEDKPATFSKSFFKFINLDTVKLDNNSYSGLGFNNNKLLITDDLSDMESSLFYMESNNMDFCKLAIEAFDAGNDILLFALMEYDKNNHFSHFRKFDIKTLKNVIDALIKHINSSEIYKNRFKESLRKVLKYKSIIIKTKEEKEKFLFTDNLDMEIKMSTNFTIIDSICKNYKTTEEFLKTLYDSATLLINKNADYNISKLNKNSKIVFAIDNANIDKFKNTFEDKFDCTFIDKNKYLNSFSKFNELKSILLKQLKNCDKLIYVISDNDNLTDGIKLISGLVDSSNQKINNKIIILMSENVGFLDENVLTNVTVIGNFSSDPIAYNSYIKILNGDLIPKNIKNNLTIDLNNKKLYDIDRNSFIKEAIGFDPLRDLNPKEKEFDIKVKSLKDEIDNLKQKNKSLKVWFAFILIIMFNISIVSHFKKLINFNWAINTLNFKKIFYLSNYNLTGKILLIILQILDLLFIIGFIIYNFNALLIFKLIFLFLILMQIIYKSFIILRKNNTLSLKNLLFTYVFWNGIWKRKNSKIDFVFIFNLVVIIILLFEKISNFFICYFDKIYDPLLSLIS